MGAARVTQETVLVGATPTRTARVTQQTLLVGGVPVRTARVTQQTLLVGGVPVRTARVTQQTVLVGVATLVAPSTTATRGLTRPRLRNASPTLDRRRRVFPFP